MSVPRHSCSFCRDSPVSERDGTCIKFFVYPCFISQVHWINMLQEYRKCQLWVRPIELLKPKFASSVMHQIRSLGVLILYFFFKSRLWTKTYDMVPHVLRKAVRTSYTMRDISRWLLWTLPGSTGRFSILLTLYNLCIEYRGGVRLRMILFHGQRQQQQ